MLWPNHVVLGNTILRWIIALGVAAGLWGLALMARRRLGSWLAGRTHRNGAALAECLASLLARTRALFLLAVAVSAGALFLECPPRLAQALDLLPVLALILQLAAWGHWGIGRLVQRRAQGEASGAARAAVLGFILRLALGSLLLLLGLDVLGFNITTLLASLGIGGIVVALAVQNLLGDLFASLAITLDQPFVIGDFIIVDQCLGTVQAIGLKTTRIRSLSGEEIVLANSDLLKSRIRNYRKLVERRIDFRFAVAYRTPVEAVAGIPATVRQVIEAQPKTRFDRAHLLEFSDAGLRFEVVYFVLDPDFNRYMDINHAILLGIMRAFLDAGIGFSFPAKSLLIQRVEGKDEL